VNLHGPSLGIGAGIAAVAIFVTFLVFDNITDEKELVLEQAKNIQPNPQKIGLDVFTENGRLILVIQMRQLLWLNLEIISVFSATNIFMKLSTTFYQTMLKQEK